MAVFGPARRPLLCAIIVGALTFAATASGKPAIERPAPIIGLEALLRGDVRSRFEALLQHLPWGRDRFCERHPQHRLCSVPAGLRGFCERHPNHRFCDDDGESPFCRRHPNHPHCDDQPPSPS